MWWIISYFPYEKLTTFESYKTLHCLYEKQISSHRSISRWNQCYENIIMVILCIRSPTFIKNVEQMKFKWMPNNCQYHFLVLNHMSWPFKQLFFELKLDLFMICCKIELSLIKNDNKLLIMMFDGKKLMQSFIWSSDMLDCMSHREIMTNTVQIFHYQSESFCEISMNHSSLNANEFDQLLNRNDDYFSSTLRIALSMTIVRIMPSVWQEIEVNCY
jgi:hypothetical protein